MANDPMHKNQITYRQTLGYGWGLVSPMLCTALIWPLRHVLGPASILMTYLLVVFLVASRFGRKASVLASLLSAPAFAFYFARPFFSFAIHDLENVIGLAVMLVVSNVTGGLLEDARFQTELAEQRVSRTDFLYRLSRDLANAANSTEVAAIGKLHIDDYFKIRCDIQLQQTLLDFLSDSPHLNKDDGAVHFNRKQNRSDSDQATMAEEIAYYPLVGTQYHFGVLMMPALADPTASETEMATFMAALCHLITQTLERMELAAEATAAALQADTEMLRNALLSSISHDLSTPLTHIVGAVNTFLERNQHLDPANRQDLLLVLDEAEHMSELTQKLLSMAKLSSGQIVLHRDWNDLEEIVGSVLNRLDKNLHNRPVRTLIPHQMPLIWVDAVLLEQVLLNLIENAIKYTPSGSPIDIEARATSDRFYLSVIDYGAGLSKDQNSKLFDKFYRGNPESDQPGVGLGLALCKTIIEAHGGTIRAKNRFGKGAEFTVELPLAAEPPRVA